jgi:type I restriction enzyme, S subunit
MSRNDTKVTTFAALIEAGILSITDGYRAKNSELGGTGLLFLRAGHVTDTHIEFSGVDRFDERLTARLEEKCSQPGDVAVTTKGNSTGRTTFVTADMPRFVYSPHLSRWRSLDTKQLVPEFLRYWSQCREFTVQLGGMAASTDMAPYLSLRDQQRLRITLPNPQAQRYIGGVLGSLDDKIEQNRRTIRALEWLARAIFKAWFLDFEPVKAKAAGARSFPGMPPDAFAALLRRFGTRPDPEGMENKAPV